jgi:hypothetical protein
MFDTGHAPLWDTNVLGWSSRRDGKVGGAAGALRGRVGDTFHMDIGDGARRHDEPPMETGMTSYVGAVALEVPTSQTSIVAGPIPCTAGPPPERARRRRASHAHASEGARREGTDRSGVFAKKLSVCGEILSLSRTKPHALSALRGGSRQGRRSAG